MKVLGLIGGLSWHATSVYYTKINQLTNQTLGSAHSSRLILCSVDFEEFNMLQNSGDINAIATKLSDLAIKLESAGAECIVLCANTAHLVADVIKQKIKIPLIHIAEETAKAIVSQKIKRVALLGTKFTMEHPFFKDPLLKFGIDTLIPDEHDKDYIHTTIFNELTNGIFKEETKEKYLEIIEKLKMAGAEAVVFGCTELSLLIDPQECSIPIFDTIEIHSKAAVEFAFSK